MIMKLINFFKTGPDAPRLNLPAAEIAKKYNIKRWIMFVGITIGYGFFYVARGSLNVAKKPIIESGVLSPSQLGQIGAALTFVYAFAKFFNGFLADRSNIRKFMAMGLIVSATVNFLMGISTLFWMFFLLWALNGWFQAMGSAPSVVTLSQWFSLKERGKLYGVWSTSHSIGEGVTSICTAVVVSYYGWRFGFGAAGAVCLAMGIALIFMLIDRPQTYGLPSVQEFKNEALPVVTADGPKISLLQQQLLALKYPAVWILGLSSALTYVCRYAISSWGVFYMQEERGYSLIKAGSIIGSAYFAGIFGALASGFISDYIFKYNRHKATLFYGILQIGSLVMLLFGPKGLLWLDIATMLVFGFAVNGIICFLGGLTAIDLTPRKVTGAVMGFIGFFSYMGATAQDLFNGAMLEKTAKVVNGQTLHNFDTVRYYWVGAAVLSVILAMSVWNAKPRND